MSAPAKVGVPEALLDATADQPGARAALAAALAAPVHAYLFAGPPGSGKRIAARAFVAELLAAGAPDPEDARRRALADPSPHPDLAWLAPQGTQHLVQDVRERVITASAYRPFEGARRAFVIEAAEAMATEAQNALLRTLEEPASFVHLVLITSQPAAVLETVRSRCQAIRFAPLGDAAVEARLSQLGLGADDGERRAAARLAGGDADRAAFLLGDEGRELRAGARACVEAALSGELAGRPGSALLRAADAAGVRAGEAAQGRALALAEDAGEIEGAAARRRSREAEEASRRAARRARTEALDLGLALVAAWLRDLAAAAEGAEDIALNADCVAELGAASHLDPRRARRAAELVMETRRRLQVNVGEELALEALLFRMEAVLTGA